MVKFLLACCYLKALRGATHVHEETCAPTQTRSSALLQAKTSKRQEVLPVATGSSTEETLPGPYCIAAGDPHVKPFDRLEMDEDCLGPMGDYWLVNTDALKVQARYMGYQRQDGYAFIKGLSITGTRLGSKTLHIPVINNGSVTYDGVALGRSFKNDFFTMQRKPGPVLITFVEKPDVNAQDRKGSVFIKFKDADGKQDILLVINQGPVQHILISAIPAALAGTTGHCGNFNNDASDDLIDLDNCGSRSKECIFPKGECPNPEDGKDRVPENCTVSESMFYAKICEASYPVPRASEWTIFNCKTDCCATRTSCPDKDDEGESASCLIRGDPHIKTWDATQMNKNVYEPLADHWLIKNKYFQIQGRYGSDRPDKRAQLVGVVISGPLMGKNLDGTHPVLLLKAGHDKVTRKLLAGKASLDGVEVDLTKLPLHNVHYKLNYGAGQDLKYFWDVDPANNAKTFNSAYTLAFLGHDGSTIATITINSKRVLAFSMQAKEWLLENVSGQCGNFNGNADDDSAPTGNPITGGDSLFTDTNPWLGQTLKGTGCGPKEKKHFKTLCQAKHKQAVSNYVVQACIVDCCDGGVCELEGDA